MQITNRIHFRNLRGDIFGGVTAAVIALPMALAFGVASGAGAIAGLWGAVLIGLFAALFGGTPALISEPTGPMTVVMTAIVTKMIAHNPENGLAMAFTTVVLAGIFQIIFGLLKLGKYVTLMPYTVISGFMSGVGLILIILQLGPFLGHVNPKGGVIEALKALPYFITTLSPAETALGFLTMAILYLMPSKLKKFVPSQLIALITGTLITIFFLSEADIHIIGEIPTGLPQLHFPIFFLDKINEMLVDGLILGMLGCIDALLTSVIADSLTQTHHDSDKELIGQGIGNLVSGLCGGLPGAGATMGTVVNIQAGGRTALSGLSRAFILLIVVLWAAPLTKNIPLAVLAGIVLKVGIDIIDWKFLKRAHRLSIKAAAIMYGVMLLTVFYDLITAVGLGVCIANILTIQRLADIQSDLVKAIDTPDDKTLLCDISRRLMEEANRRIMLLDLSGPMSFGAAKAITQRQAILDNYDALIIDLKGVPLLGVTATLAIEKMIDEASKKSIEIYIIGDNLKIKERLQKFDIFQRIPLQNRFDTRVAALHLAVAKLKGETLKKFDE
ncbi:SulP family inorganic anion transporter [cyanobacterium endosymbiont of Epithemia clementina EcSB]|uniref:SulP family inorganic anion transporter n=1 Tax=cyanobacterium endosymbiont of Epithemia clementina EcSB TaxID=3034674 RepID=UPI00247FE8CC|nr:SulP family inorganic anion transporter [cyanobacterium endosymbiont of Epithemia clementina EcSB]WGT67276.1 SulP family inorganic anion transporter [cyanobacterium endosymbiont of Epithemia clementina EcSB]